MKQGFLQALGVAVYIFLIGVFISNVSKVTPHINSFFAPIVFLLLFSTSALICGLIVFYKPYKLFFAGKKTEAVEVVISTTIFLFAFLVIFFGGLLLFR